MQCHSEGRGHFKQSLTRNRRIDKSVLTCSTVWEEDYDNPQNSHNDQRTASGWGLAGNSTGSAHRWLPTYRGWRGGQSRNESRNVRTARTGRHPDAQYAVSGAGSSRNSTPLVHVDKSHSQRFKDEPVGRSIPVGGPGLYFRGFFQGSLGGAIVQKKSGPTFRRPQT